MVYWCNGTFSSSHPTIEEMCMCIRSWLDVYANKFFIRLSVIDKATGKPIGTIEIFDKMDIATRGAALQMDLSAPYETQAYITEFLTLADKEFFPLFGFKYLIVWATPAAKERTQALRSAGYTPFDSDNRENYFRKESSCLGG
jgi:hypothetical protein